MVPARHGAQNTSTNRNGKAIRRATGSGAKPFCGIIVAEAELFLSYDIDRTI